MEKIYDGGCCMGGLEAIDFFQSLKDRLTEEEVTQFDKAMNRIRWQMARELGRPVKITPPPKRGWMTTRACGQCGCVIAEAWHEFCPKCGYRIQTNEYAQRKTREYEEKNRVCIEAWAEGGDT